MTTTPTTIAIDAAFTYRAKEETDVLLQFEAADIPEQEVLEAATDLGDNEHAARVPAQDAIGHRVWLRVEGEFACTYRARVKVDRLLTPLGDCGQLDPSKLPGETVQYLFDSRYVQSEQLQGFVLDEFGHLSGGARILAMQDWVAKKFAYTPGASDATTTAIDSFVARRGICRDYAHVMVALTRASTIPARFVSCYAPGVEPPDFHAVAEVFLADPTTPGGGAWFLVDATEMADPAQIAKIGVGRDAADVSFLTSFGLVEFVDKTVNVRPA